MERKSELEETERNRTGEREYHLWKLEAGRSIEMATRRIRENYLIKIMGMANNLSVRGREIMNGKPLKWSEDLKLAMEVETAKQLRGFVRKKLIEKY